MTTSDKKGFIWGLAGWGVVLYWLFTGGDMNPWHGDNNITTMSH